MMTMMAHDDHPQREVGLWVPRDIITVIAVVSSGKEAILRCPPASIPAAAEAWPNPSRGPLA